MIPSLLARAGRRLQQHLETIRLLRNWPTVLAAARGGPRVRKLLFRKGWVVSGPKELDLAFLFHEIWLDRLYAPPGYEIRRGVIVVDVGANVGVFSIFAASRHPDVRVLAFEPFPPAFRLLEQNVANSRLGNVQPMPWAVGGHSGKVPLNVCSTNWLVHSTEASHTGEPVLVDCVSLERVYADRAIGRCDLLKLDCEGAEHAILSEASPEMLSRTRRIVVEIHDLGTTRTSSSLRRFLETRHFAIDFFRGENEPVGFLAARATDGP